MNSAVYVPTKERMTFAIRAIQAIGDALRSSGMDIPVYLVSERQYRTEVLDELDGIVGVEPVFLKGSNRGIGYARNAIVQHADREGYASIAMVDDDQVLKGDVAEWLAAAARPDVTSIGAYKSIYGLLCGGEMAKRWREPGVWLHKGSVGNQCVALNVATVVALGNYDPALRGMEDHELCREAYEQRGTPWFIYTGVQAGDQLARKHMHTVGGGIYTGGPEQTERNWKEAHRLCWERWPEYISTPDKAYRCSWKRLVQDFTNIAVWPMENVRSDKPWDWQ